LKENRMNPDWRETFSQGTLVCFRGPLFAGETPGSSQRKGSHPKKAKPGGRTRRKGRVSARPSLERGGLSGEEGGADPKVASYKRL